MKTSKIDFSHRGAVVTLVVASWVLWAIPADADLTITMETGGVERIMYLTPTRMCVKDLDGIMIFDAKTQVLSMVDMDSKTVREITKKDLELMGSMAGRNAPDAEQMDEYAKAMEEARQKAMEEIKNLPEDQRKMAEEALNQRMPPPPPAAGGAPKRIYQPMNKEETISGYKCAGYTAKKGDKVIGEVWTAGFDELDITPEDVVVIGALRDFFRIGLASMPFLEDAMAEFDALDPESESFIGFPVRQIDIDAGQKAVTQLISIDKDKVDGKVFEIGKDYKRESLMGE